MLEIYVKGHEQPLMCRERLEALLHDVRVVQGVPFLALEDHGDLLNLNEVWRIVEVTEQDTPDQVADSSGGMLHYPMDGSSNTHQGPRESCPICTAVADVEAQQADPFPGAPTILETCQHGYIKDTCSQCEADEG